MKHRAFLMMASLLGAFLVSGDASADHAPYHPNWSVGDQWTVDISSQLARAPKEESPGGLPVSTETTRYNYEVVAEAVEGGQTIVTIEVSEVGESPSWILTIDEGSTLLLSVEKIESRGPNTTYVNPYDDAWFAAPNRDPASVLHDFPSFPESGVDESRLISSTIGGVLPFTQSVTFVAGSATAALNRTDPASGLVEETRFTWLADQNWWSQADRRLGSETFATAVPEPEFLLGLIAGLVMLRALNARRSSGDRCT